MGGESRNGCFLKRLQRSKQSIVEFSIPHYKPIQGCSAYFVHGTNIPIVKYLSGFSGLTHYLNPSFFLQADLQDSLLSVPHSLPDTATQSVLPSFDFL